MAAPAVHSSISIKYYITTLNTYIVGFTSTQSINTNTLVEVKFITLTKETESRAAVTGTYEERKTSWT